MGWKGAGGLGKKEDGIASSSVVTKEHKSVSQSSRNVKGLGSKKNKRDDGEEEKVMIVRIGRRPRGTGRDKRPISIPRSTS